MSDDEEFEGLEEEDEGGGLGVDGGPVEEGGCTCSSWCEVDCAGLPQNRLAPGKRVMGKNGDDVSYKPLPGDLTAQ